MSGTDHGLVNVGFKINPIVDSQDYVLWLSRPS